MLADVAEKIAPVWPLKDYIAVNPFAGVSNRKFLDARSFLKVFSDCETLMPLEYYAKRSIRHDFGDAEILSAISEFRYTKILPDDSLGVDDVIATMEGAHVADHARRNFDVIDATDAASSAAFECSTNSQCPTNSQCSKNSQGSTNSRRLIRTFAETLSESHAIDWADFVVDEIGKHCAAHYDGGQAAWASPWKDLPLYEFWQRTAARDRNAHILGLTNFHKFVADLPSTADAAITHLLNRLAVPEHLAAMVLLCQAYSVLGWSAWAKYQSAWSGDPARQDDLAGLLAMRLAYDVALGERFGLNMHWSDISFVDAAHSDAAVDRETLIRLVLLRASEISLRNEIIASLDVSKELPTLAPENCDKARPAVQMVFCIDVRSERIRRHLETDWPELETFGFAGFFGMPIRYIPVGQSGGTASLPVLLQPSIDVREGLRCSGQPPLNGSTHALSRESLDDGADPEDSIIAKRVSIRLWRKSWKWFQTSVVGCFPFVESTGPLFAWKLLGRSLRWTGQTSVGAARLDGVDASFQSRLGPSEETLHTDHWPVQEQADVAEGMLRNLGMIETFARLVVLCGHASQTDNNPLAAGLDCGACGGHTGEPNARFAAMLLNRPMVRNVLKNRGITIPTDCVFVGGLHNTTTDEVSLFDRDHIPASHHDDVAMLLDRARLATVRTRAERAPLVGTADANDLLRRARDWSEVQPEWGLAGNAAFIVAPREMTRHSSLDGRSFLHSYEHKNDFDSSVLETIMTAPMVVAHWINMQYYASTVDNGHFGSGSKTVHNVVGNFGILSGNGGDLQTGLPLQSLQAGGEFQYAPMRLQSIIAAPRDSIQRVITKHPLLQDLLNGQWMHVIAIENDSFFQYAPDGDWVKLER
ncbi:MAG: DUF2309 domain-containing protein [Planctomycetota bacterium]